MGLVLFWFAFYHSQPQKCLQAGEGRTNLDGMCNDVEGEASMACYNGRKSDPLGILGDSRPTAK